ncbi:hypothetical protein QE152_g33957 [Popillia japonica]|uniref:Uncharacterized protein n=1 Tax=Popillia japonica TaxID=7064 RepID=A0AAW1IVV6_POPJA
MEKIQSTSKQSDTITKAGALLRLLNYPKKKGKIYTLSDDIDVSRSRKRKKVDERTSYVSTTVQAKEVCDTIISEIKRRFSFTDHLERANLFSVENFETETNSRRSWK